MYTRFDNGDGCVAWHAEILENENYDLEYIIANFSRGPMLRLLENDPLGNKELLGENNILVNALQRKSKVIIQKSIREGFGLTVTEALWKETPVVTTKVGGIPLQVNDGENGFLLEPDEVDGFAEKIVELLEKPKLAAELGRAGKEIVREKFLVTRILTDYLDLFNELNGCS